MIGSSSAHETQQGQRLVIIQSPLIKSFLAGTLGGTTSTILLQPLDLIKTRLQRSTNLGNRLGMFTEFSTIIKEKSVKGLWSGLVPSLCRIVPGAGLYFMCFHWLKTTFGTANPHPLESIAIGATSRSFAGIMVLPLTVIKTRFESGEFRYTSILHAINTIYAKEGIRGLYCGLAPTLVRDVPYSGLYLMFYTKLKQMSSGRSGEYVMLYDFCNGGMAACMASLATQPADVIKTTLQLYYTKGFRLKTAVLHVYGETGLRGFLRGFVPRVLRRTLMSAMSWSVYEEVMRVCHIKT